MLQSRDGFWLGMPQSGDVMPLTLIAPLSLGQSFRTTLLLTGNVARAEDAVREAIHALDSEARDSEEMSREALLSGAIVAALRESSATRRQGDPASAVLPPELRRVLRLPADLRRCFVLRILVALSRARCAQLLNLSVAEVDENACAAARMLARASDHAMAIAV